MPSLPLLPHPATPAPWVRALRVACGWREDGGLDLRYLLRAEPGRLLLPEPAPGGRADGLWRHTCFELFAAADAPGYREYNFSPAGNWQAYAFADYRQGGPLSCAVAPTLTLSRTADGLELAVLLPRAALPEGIRRLGISAVLEAGDGGLSYWALRHAPGKPDFHHPDTFALDFHPPPPSA